LERAVSEGLRWARSVLDHVFLLFGIVALAVGVTVGGLLLHRPGWFLGIFGGLVLLLVLGEGAYRVFGEQQQVAAEPDADALWLSERLSAGNKLLARWHVGTQRYNATEEIRRAADWERDTQDGLTARLPTYSGIFDLEPGLGREFIFSPVEVAERTRLRRRLHRLKEIADRYEQRRGT
jgi:hypothetical protein